MSSSSVYANRALKQPVSCLIRRLENVYASTNASNVETQLNFWRTAIVCANMFSSITKARSYINCLDVSPLGGTRA